jgi:hypothetical protein
MKEIKLAMWILIPLLLCVLVGSFYSSFLQKVQEIETLKAGIYSRDSYLIDSVSNSFRLKEIDKLDSIARDKQAEISKRDKENKILSGKIKTEKQRADSAEARYRREFTKETCDSALMAKNNVIKAQDVAIDSLNIQVISYSDMAILFKSKADLQSEVINTHQETINAFQDNVTILNKQLKKERKIPKWVYTLGGFTGGILTILIIK